MADIGASACSSKQHVGAKASRAHSVDDEYLSRIAAAAKGDQQDENGRPDWTLRVARHWMPFRLSRSFGPARTLQQVVICCIASSTAPLIKGLWSRLREGRRQPFRKLGASQIDLRQSAGSEAGAALGAAVTSDSALVLLDRLRNRCHCNSSNLPHSMTIKSLCQTTR